MWGGWWNCSGSWLWWWLHESLHVLQFIEMYTQKHYPLSWVILKIIFKNLQQWNLNSQWCVTHALVPRAVSATSLCSPESPWLHWLPFLTIPTPLSHAEPCSSSNGANQLYPQSFLLSGPSSAMLFSQLVLVCLGLTTLKHHITNTNEPHSIWDATSTHLRAVGIYSWLHSSKLPEHLHVEICIILSQITVRKLLFLYFSIYYS